MHDLFKRITLALALIFIAAVPLSSAQAQSDPAIATVQGFYDTLLASMKGGKALGPQGRFDKLKLAVDEAFDFGTMIKFAVGPAWDSAAPADQKALTAAFARMTAAQYAGNFSGFDGEKFVFCFAPQGDRPTKFETEGYEKIVVTLTREKD